MKWSLNVREVAFLLQESEMIIRRLISSGELQRLPGHRVLVDPAAVRALFPRDAGFTLRCLALNAILEQRFRVPAPRPRWGPPAPLSAFADELREDNRYEIEAGRTDATEDRLVATEDRTQSWKMSVLNDHHPGHRAQLQGGRANFRERSDAIEQQWLRGEGRAELGQEHDRA